MSFALYLIFAMSSQKYGLPSGLLASVCYVESSYNVKAIHKHDGQGDSIGICQIKYKTAKWLGFKGSEKDLFNPKVNIEYAAKYLARNMKRYRRDVHKALIAYNQGSAGQLKTSKYSLKVTKLLRQRRETLWISKN